MTGRDFAAYGAIRAAAENDVRSKKIKKNGKIDFTETQGQYLAFIYNYSVIHGRAPAEAELERFFGTTPPTIHQMILKLEQKGMISRVPHQARSMKLLLPAEVLPILKPRET